MFHLMLVCFLLLLLLACCLARVQGCECLAKTLFNIVVVLCTLVPYIVAKIGLCLTRCGCGRECFARLYKPMLASCWQLMFCLCSCWIRFEDEGLAEMRRDLKANSGKPRLIIQNHTSFLDAMIAVKCIPVCSMSDLKALTSEHLFKMCALGTLMEACGHFSIPFKNHETTAAAVPESGGTDKVKKAPSKADFTVDKDKTLEVMKAFEEHVKNGGIGAWYPEGRMNPDPDTIQTFRAGGFGVATDVDCSVWCLVTCGNDLCWPRKSGVGGLPCKIRIKCFKLCDSTFAYFGKANVGEDKAKQRMHMANEAHQRFQEEYNEMVQSSRVNARENDKGMLASPLI